MRKARVEFCRWHHRADSAFARRCAEDGKQSGTNCEFQTAHRQDGTPILSDFNSNLIDLCIYTLLWINVVARSNHISPPS
jgi:hypothetical protein